MKSEILLVWNAELVPVVAGMYRYICTAYPQGFITHVITRLYRPPVHFDLHASRAPQSVAIGGVHRTLLEELAHRWFHVHLRTLIS